MIVIDVGCARHGDSYSIERLVDEFHPETLIGLDPVSPPYIKDIDGTFVYVMPVAAWTHDGVVGFKPQGTSGHIAFYAPPVPCVDLADLIDLWSSRDEIILKLDAEGAEYPLLEHLIERGADEKLELAIVEWHPGGNRGDIERRLRCETKEWQW